MPRTFALLGALGALLAVLVAACPTLVVAAGLTALALLTLLVPLLVPRVSLGPFELLGSGPLSQLTLVLVKHLACSFRTHVFELLVLLIVLLELLPFCGGPHAADVAKERGKTLASTFSAPLCCLLLCPGTPMQLLKPSTLEVGIYLAQLVCGLILHGPEHVLVCRAGGDNDFSLLENITQQTLVLLKLDLHPLDQIRKQLLGPAAVCIALNHQVCVFRLDCRCVLLPPCLDCDEAHLPVPLQ
mmetsp:Transcript_19039/g.32584  ORF Transcript_19039/g.32584 Transcript_19039/m.32584 type:complete len:243 (+) Transcript_19039:903-1631(+)